MLISFKFLNNPEMDDIVSGKASTGFLEES